MSNIDTAKTGAITDITDLKNNSISSMETAKSEALTEIETLHNSSVDDITNLKNTSISNITTAKNNAITSITNQETTSKNNVVATGNEQVERVNLTGVDNRTPIFSKSEVETNEGVYQNVYDLKRSTFDLSKFTVVGSPTITDDGIASEFSASDYLVIDGEVETGSNFEIVVKAKTGSDILLPRMIIGGRAASNGVFNLGIYQGKLYCSSNALYFPQIQGATVQPNTEYYFKAGIKDNIPYVGVSSDGLTYDVTNGTLKTYPPHLKLMIGWILNSEYAWQGSIDLKQFSITVDGEEVFNGNKTGIDTIKPDNYTVVGTPTISADGIASGFSRSNYLTLNSSDLTGSNNYSINLNFTFTSSLTASEYDYIMSDSNGSQYGISIYRLYNILYARCNSNNNLVALATSVSLNTPYNVEINVANGICSIDTTVNQQTSTKTLDISEIQEWSNVILLGNRFGDSTSSRFRGSIDLNAYKIYVDGNLVYQPCLKIPYTESKTGSKIVDVAYRERVIDLYEQEGKAGYYTIDEPNQNFTLPMGEIYGMIGQRSLISSTVTETNRVDIYSDKTCLICGNVATSGTINLPIELANNNYFITLSTSEKTATSFTTTATGDYILIGKVI